MVTTVNKVSMCSPRATLSVDRLVILEWLDADTPQSGTTLWNAVSSEHPTLPVTCIKCTSRQDLLTEIANLTRQVSVQDGGVPILHIEARGYRFPGETGLGLGMVGPSANGGSTTLLWKDLAEPLRRLNIATRFNLVLVGPACWSDNAIYSVQTRPVFRSLPFVLAAGFTTEARSDRLERALVTFYSELMSHSRSIRTSYEVARASLDGAEDAIAWFSMSNIVQKASIDAVRVMGNPEEYEDRYIQILANLEHLGPQQGASQSQAPDVIEHMLAKLLAYDQVPDNRVRFGLKGRALAQDAARVIAESLVSDERSVATSNSVRAPKPAADPSENLPAAVE